MGKFKFKPYCGNDKYHFRIYKRIRHPFIVVEVNELHRTISGYVITTSPTSGKKYHLLSKNPNPNDSKQSFVATYRTTAKISLFSKPYNNWHLSSADKALIDSIEEYKKDHLK